VTKLDVLDEFDSIPVCVGYRAGGKELTEMPPRVACMENVEPVYERLPGWKTSTFGMSSYDELPARAKDYLAFLEARVGVEVGSVPPAPNARKLSCARVRGWKRCWASDTHGGATSSAGAIPLPDALASRVAYRFATSRA